MPSRTEGNFNKMKSGDFNEENYVMAEEDKLKEEQKAELDRALENASSLSVLIDLGRWSKKLISLLSSHSQRCSVRTEC